MRNKIVLLALLLSAQHAISQVSFVNMESDDRLIVQTKAGQLRGTHLNGVDIFKGIPFASPPVGKFRWRPPQPVTPWEGIRDANKYGFNCAQAGWPRNPGVIAEGSSEDCLYLNIWRPSLSNPKQKRPVMVWIHGGAFVAGSGSQSEFSGIHFAQQGVLLVTFNYRLGRLGFFAHPALNLEYPEEPKGNYGYMDQIAALHWIQQNIAAFGGDPNNVTIFGESAGGVSVHSLLTIPSASGLFHKAILQSAGGRDGILSGRPLRADSSNTLYPVSAETCGLNFARRFGIEGKDTLAVAQLRSLRVEDIVDGGNELNVENGQRTYSGPILDSKLVIETFEKAYKEGRVPQIPILIGSNIAEMQGAFVVGADTEDELFSQFGALQQEALAAYQPMKDKELTELLSMVNTDKVWAEPARFTAEAFAKKGVPAYVYLFSYVADSLRNQMPYGASHGSEIAYVFKNLDSRRGLSSSSRIDQSVANLMNAYWSNFAKTGNPNDAGLPEWPVYRPKRQYLLEFEPTGEARAKKDPKKQRLDVISKELKIGKLQKKGV